MLIRRPVDGFGLGYTPIVEHIDNRGPNSMLLDFGVLRMRRESAEHAHYRNSANTERAFLLLSGEVVFSYGGVHAVARRSNPFDDEPTVLHVPARVMVEIEAKSDAVEIVIQQVFNEMHFAARVLREGDYRSDMFGEGVLEGTSTRCVRTLFDAATVPDSAMVMGEVLSSQGRWSSYPPHTHAHPEIYHFRFSPAHGFGYSEHGDDVHKIQHEDSALISPNVTHPQATAPGYALFYVWSIPHLPHDRFGPDSRRFVSRHRWLV